MSKSNTFENDLLKHIFQNADIALIGDAAGVLASSTAGNLYVSLHTGDPGEAGDQTTNETVYSDYLRVAVPRAAVTGWTVTTDTASNAVQIQFATCGATGATLTYFGVGTASSGAGKLLYSGQLTSQLAVATGIQPQFAIGALTVTEG